MSYGPWGRKEDTTELLHFHFHALEKEENPRDGGAWGAAVYGVAQSRTQLKRLSSSSSSCPTLGACAGGLCHTVIQGSRQPEAPPAGDTVDRKSVV